jgi:hypothetical protein
MNELIESESESESYVTADGQPTSLSGAKYQLTTRFFITV